MDLLTDSKISNFLKKRDQVDLDEEALQGLFSEDTGSSLDLAEFEKEQTETLAKNMCKPKGNRMPYPDQ